MQIRSTRASALTLTETRALMRFCGCQRESLWDDLDLQGVLDVYHAIGDWDGVDAALHGDDNVRRAVLQAMKRSYVRCWG